MKKHLGLILSVLIPMAITVQAQVLNPANGHYYQYVAAPLNWDAAYAAASSMTYKGMTGYLATIEDSQEQTFITSNFGVNFPAQFATTPVWLGGFQQPGSVEPDGGWTWVTSNAVSYTYWGFGEPNNNGNENVIEIRRDGRWNDTSQTYLGKGFLVEFQPVFQVWIQVSTVDVCWDSKTNKTYQVQYRSELTTNLWTDLGSPVPGNGSTICVTEPVEGRAQRFYRVVESSQP